MENQSNNILSEVEKLNYSNFVLGLDKYASDDELSDVELFRDYPVPLLRFVSVCCILFMIIGIPGNLMTIISLARYKQIQNATAIFIINLSIADFLFCCFVLPTVSVSYWTRTWVHGRLFCRIFPLMNYVFVIVSLLTVVAITINRYILLCHPNLYNTLYTRRNIAIMLAMMWIFAVVLLLLPFFEVWGRLTLDPHVGACTIVPDQNKRSPKKWIVSFLFIFVCTTIIICYARIVWVVRKSSSKSHVRTSGRFEMQSVNFTTTQFIGASDSSNCPMTSSSTMSTDNESEQCFNEVDLSSYSQNNEQAQTRLNLRVKARNSNKKGLPTKKDKKLRMLVMAVMLCFCICYLPMTLTKILYKRFTTYPLANMLSYLTIYLTPCINPIIYVLMSKEYRMAYRSLFRFKRQR